MNVDDRVPDVECEQHHAGLTVGDFGAALEFYEKKLGFQPAFTDGDPPSFAGVNLGGVQIFLMRGSAAPSNGSAYFVVGNADELYAFHRSAGVEVVVPIDDRPYGLRDYTVRDPDGNHLTFGHRHFNAGPTTTIERVDVPVRLEKRLAALLADLAEHKRMSVSSCLEEILLHTNEPLGDGVASPHSKQDLAYIQKLKVRHGIDYDSHASYRWTE